MLLIADLHGMRAAFVYAISALFVTVLALVFLIKTNLSYHQLQCAKSFQMSADALDAEHACMEYTHFSLDLWMVVNRINFQCEFW